MLGNEKKTSEMIGGLGLWMCGERGDDDVSALFMSVLRRCPRHTATDHSVPHKWKINKPQMGV